MARYHAEIAKLIIYNSQKSETFVGCFLTQPKLEEERLGQVFIVSEIKKRNIKEVSPGTCQKFIDVLSSSIRNNYYGKSKNNEEFGSESVELMFEAALQKTNRDLQTYLLAEEKKEIEAFLDNTNIAIGVALKHSVYFAAIGNIEAFLVRKNRISNVLAASQEASGEKEIKVNPAKIFSHLISGSLETDDGLIFTTPSLLDYFSLEKIKRIVKENPANKAVANMHALVSEIDEKVALAVILVKLGTGSLKGEDDKTDSYKPAYLPPKRATMLRRPEKKGVEDSIAELLNRQEETNKIITPTVGGLFKRMVPKFLKKGRKTKQKEAKGSGQLGETIKSYRQIERPRMKRPSKIRIPKPKINFNFIGSLFNRLTSVRGKIKIKERGPFDPAQGLRKKIGWLSKLILAVCVIFAILFIQSLFTLNKKRSEQKNEEVFTQEIEKIEQDSERASSRLIIGDEGTAMDIYENILGNIKELPAETSEQEEKARELKDKITKKINEINKIKEVSLSEVVDLGALSFFQEFEAEQILRIENRFFIISSDAKVYEYSFATGEIKKFSELDLDNIKKIKRFDEDNLIIRYDSSFALFNLENKVLAPVSIEGRDDIVITDFDVYNNRLYIMDAEKNLILRYTKLGSIFSREALWLKDDTNIRKAVSMSIDGSVWILTSDGEVLALRKGVLDDISSEEARPAMIRPANIWTELALENVYFMDAGTKRIAVISKRGELVGQYMAEFEDLRSMVSSLDEEMVYVLDEKMIYEFLIE